MIDPQTKDYGDPAARTLLVVDPQMDFVSGSLAVPHAQEAIEVIRLLAPHYKERIVSLDWHPVNHCSFEESGGTWPEHCVAHTSGAMLADRSFESFTHVYKGMVPELEAYSAFEGVTRGGASLLELLLGQDEPGTVEVVGLALDYCVKATALDAKKHGFNVIVNLYATRPVDLKTGSEAIYEMGHAGIVVSYPRVRPFQYLEALQEGRVPILHHDRR